MQIASSVAFLKMWRLKFVHTFSNKNRFIDIVLIALNPEHQSLKNFVSSADKSLSHAFFIAAQMFLSRNRIFIGRVNKSQVGQTLLRQRTGQLSEIFLLELSAHFHERLRDCQCLHSSSVQGLRIILVRPQKFLTTLLICLRLGSGTRLLRSLLSITSN